MEWLAETLALDRGQAAYLVAAFFAAGVFRGFSGFGSSALVMASTVFILPPVAMIPVCWILALAASLAMLRSGVRDANRRIVAVLTLGLVVGGAAGLQLTTSIPVDLSRTIALLLIVALVALQLAGLRAPALATGGGLNAAALGSGLAYGLAGVGGMAAAVHVLALRLNARTARNEAWHRPLCLGFILLISGVGVVRSVLS